MTHGLCRAKETSLEVHGHNMCLTILSGHESLEGQIFIEFLSELEEGGTMGGSEQCSRSEDRFSLDLGV
jgi:hypothetical protein